MVRGGTYEIFFKAPNLPGRFFVRALRLGQQGGNNTSRRIGRKFVPPFPCVWSWLAVYFDAESNNLYATVVFNLHLNWLLMAFCRSTGVEPWCAPRVREQSNTETFEWHTTLARFNESPTLFSTLFIIFLCISQLAARAIFERVPSISRRG